MGIIDPLKTGFKKSTKRFSSNVGSGLSSVDTSSADPTLSTVFSNCVSTVKPQLKSDLHSVGGFFKKPFVYAWTESGIKDKIVDAWENNIKEPFGLTTDGVKDSFGKAVDNLNVPFLSKKDVENGVDLEKFRDMKSLLDLDGLNAEDFIPSNFNAEEMAKKQGVDTSGAGSLSINIPELKDIKSGNIKDLKLDGLSSNADFISTGMSTINTKTKDLNTTIKSNSSLFDLDNAFDTSNMLGAFTDTEKESNKLINNPFHNEFDFKNLIDPEKMSYFEAIESGNSFSMLKLNESSGDLTKYAIRPGADYIPFEKYDDYMYADMPKANMLYGKPDADINRYGIIDYNIEDLNDKMYKQLHSFNDISQYDPFKKLEQMDIYGSLDNSEMFFGYLNEGSELMREDAKNIKSIVNKNKNPFFSDGYEPLKVTTRINSEDFKSIIGNVKGTIHSLFGR